MMRLVLLTLIMLAVLGGSAWLYLGHAKFGALPAGARLERVKKSPNFRDGEFHNQIPTQMMTGSKGSLAMWREFLFNGSRRLKPAGAIPSVKQDLLGLPPEKNAVAWFGHSSYFIQAGDKRLLVDPVLSGRASPLPFTTKAFEGTDAYTAADIPEIDALFITHDHWDHLDYETMVKLRSKVKRVVCPLGVGAHLERWGYDPAVIAEGDWGDKVDLGSGLTATVLPARHFSGRTFTRNRTLWASFAVTAPGGYKIYLGGDGGYGPHFKDIGREFGGFDLAMLENGQYDKSWALIHMMPDEVLRAAEDLRAARVVPVHNSKFSISNHDWDAPLRTITAIAGKSRGRLLTPMIGSIVDLKAPAAEVADWWAAAE